MLTFVHIFICADSFISDLVIMYFQGYLDLHDQYMSSVFSCVYCGASVLWVHLMKSQPSLLYWIFNGCSFYNFTSLVCIFQSLISDNDRLKSDRSYVSKWLRGGERHGISNFPNKLFISYTDIFRLCLYQLKWSRSVVSDSLRPHGL